MRNIKVEKAIWFLVTSVICYHSFLYIQSEVSTVFLRLASGSIMALASVVGYVLFSTKQNIEELAKTPYTIFVIGGAGALVGTIYGMVLVLAYSILFAG